MLFSAGFVVSLGFACWLFVSFWSFWPPALVQQSQAAIVFVALCSLGGAALFRSSCPSPNPSYRFGLLALTFRSSRPAFCGRLTSPVSPHKTPYIQAMLFQTAFSFSSVVQRLVCRFSGLRLQAAWEFQAFLASSPCTASASSYHSSSIAPPPWRCAFSPCWPVVKLGLPVLGSGSNTAVKPTRILRSAYFGR